jgi:hypothetical protein
MNTKDVLLTAATLPKYARKEYFINEQVKSGYSLLTFLKLLTECAYGYINRIESVVDERNAAANSAGYENIYSISGYSIPERIIVENVQFVVPVDTQLLHELLSNIKEVVTGKPIKQPKEQKPAAEVIATFCNIVNDTGVMIRKDGESATLYCKRVGKFFSVDINESVRKYLHNDPSKGNMETVLNLIVSHIEDNTIKDKITTYINKRLSA